MNDIAVDNSKRHVLVVGGGIAGLAAARALSLRGIRSTVIERSELSADGGLAINLPGNAMAALQRLGVGDEAEKYGHTIAQRDYRSSSGRLLCSINEDAFWAPSLRSRALRRQDLVNVLRTGLQKKNLLYGRTVAAIEQSPDAVRVRLADGTLLVGDLLVGADGVNSMTRRSMTGESAQSASLLGDAAWRFMVPNPGVDHWTVWSDSRAAILLMPVDEEVYGWAALRDEGMRREDDALATASMRFPTVVREAVASALRSPAMLYYSAMRAVRTTRWKAERILLIGDAAHATAPVWAQGAAMAMEDALVLAEELATHPDWALALETYQARRTPRISHVRNMTDATSRAARMPSWLRDLILPVLGPRTFRKSYGLLKDAP